MSIEINDVVRLIDNQPSDGLLSGALGVVVAVFSEPREAYEVEFCDEDGCTIAQLALLPSQFEVLK
ncbi:DUF4926 domain-containing protein [Pseudomonas aeruginosa]|nr:DUF4926 domain-containing protein [Pseudomonas aeruginosa]